MNETGIMLFVDRDMRANANYYGNYCNQTKGNGIVLQRIGSRLRKILVETEQ